MHDSYRRWERREKRDTHSARQGAFFGVLV